MDGIALSTHFGDMITADHKNLNEENESRFGHRNATVVQHDFTNFFQGCPMKNGRHVGDNVVFTKMSSSFAEAGKNFHRQFTVISWGLSRSTMESWHKHLSSLRKERSRREGRPQSVRRDSYRTSAKWTTWRMVVLCDGMLLSLVQRARQDGRWQDGGRPIPFRTLIGWVHSDYREGQVKDPSVCGNKRWEEYS